MRYRHKPLEVEAWRYTGDNADDLHRQIGRMKRDLPGKQVGVFNKTGLYQTADPGDFIVRAEDGNTAVFKADDFLKRYEPVE